MTVSEKWPRSNRRTPGWRDGRAGARPACTARQRQNLGERGRRRQRLGNVAARERDAVGAARRDEGVQELETRQELREERVFVGDDDGAVRVHRVAGEEHALAPQPEAERVRRVARRVQHLEDVVGVFGQGNVLAVGEPARDVVRRDGAADLDCERSVARCERRVGELLVGAARGELAAARRQNSSTKSA